MVYYSHLRSTRPMCYGSNRVAQMRTMRLRIETSVRICAIVGYCVCECVCYSYVRSLYRIQLFKLVLRCKVLMNNQCRLARSWPECAFTRNKGSHTPNLVHREWYSKLGSTLVHCSVSRGHRSVSYAFIWFSSYIYIIVIIIYAAQPAIPILFATSVILVAQWRCRCRCCLESSSLGGLFLFIIIRMCDNIYMPDACLLQELEVS